MKNTPLSKLAKVTEVSESEISSIKSDTIFDAILLKTNFDYKDFGKPSILDVNDQFLIQTKALVDKAKSYLKDGGLLFIWGLPNYLSFLGEYIEKGTEDYSYLFKYWIAIELGNTKTECLPSSHIGVLMYLKTKSIKYPTPFNLNTKFVRVPYVHCPSCGKINKDWGGKTHLLNPLGSAVSDVWDFHEEKPSGNKVPFIVIERILKLLGTGKSLLQINQHKVKYNLNEIPQNNDIKIKQKHLLFTADQVINESCTDYLKKLKQKYPDGIIDLAFADPPYNLAKNYSIYKDDRAEEHYIAWCNDWLRGMYENLKPGGALFVLNIPKWSIYHFNFLADKMIFKNWIVWDALSTPAGKLLPAHYSLLYFVKPGGKSIINLEEAAVIDSREYCLRASCIKKRKEKGNDEKERLTDIWKDIHRIKHKKDRDHHPCQLPTKLMERIIKLFSNEGDIVFDPFGGAGTTAIAAKVLNRKFIITEIDKRYVEISNKNLARLKKDNKGQILYKRDSTKKSNFGDFPKKRFEKLYLDLSINHKKPLNQEELKSYDKELFKLLELYKGDFSKIYATAKRRVETLNTINVA